MATTTTKNYPSLPYNYMNTPTKKPTDYPGPPVNTQVVKKEEPEKIKLNQTMSQDFGNKVVSNEPNNALVVSKSSTVQQPSQTNASRPPTIVVSKKAPEAQAWTNNKTNIQTDDQKEFQALIQKRKTLEDRRAELARELQEEAQKNHVMSEVMSFVSVGSKAEI